MPDQTWSIAEKTVLITGANRGIGLATATELARRGARIIVCCRSEDKANEAKEYIQKETNNREIHTLMADLAALSSIRTACEDFGVRFDRLDVLINNAAVITQERKQSVDGYELQFAVNHLAPFAMTGLLLERLRSAGQARIITVSSAAHRRATLDLSDLTNANGKYDRVAAYARSKLANILFTAELARKLEGEPITANCLHPGVIDTGLLQDYSGLPRTLGFITKVFKGTARGARTSVYLASAPDLQDTSGKYFDNCKLAQPDSEAGDRDQAARLWQVSEEFTGVAY